MIQSNINHIKLLNANFYHINNHYLNKSKYYILRKFNVLQNHYNTDTFIYLKSSSLLHKISICYKYSYTHFFYLVTQLTFNPIIKSIKIKNYYHLKIPKYILYKYLRKQLGKPMSYQFLNLSLKQIHKWYIDRGFKWIKIFFLNDQKNHIYIYIYEGRIHNYQILYIKNQFILNNTYIKKINYILLKELNFKKNCVLNLYQINQSINKLEKKYTKINLYYDISDVNNQVAIKIKYNFYYINKKFFHKQYMKSPFYISTFSYYKKIFFYLLSQHFFVINLFHLIKYINEYKLTNFYIFNIKKLSFKINIKILRTLYNKVHEINIFILNKKYLQIYCMNILGYICSSYHNFLISPQQMIMSLPNILFYTYQNNLIYLLFKIDNKFIKIHLVSQKFSYKYMLYIKKYIIYITNNRYRKLKKSISFNFISYEMKFKYHYISNLLNKIQINNHIIHVSYKTFIYLEKKILGYFNKPIYYTNQIKFSYKKNHEFFVINNWKNNFIFILEKYFLIYYTKYNFIFSGNNHNKKVYYNHQILLQISYHINMIQYINIYFKLDYIPYIFDKKYIKYILPYKYNLFYNLRYGIEVKIPNLNLPYLRIEYNLKQYNNYIMYIYYNI